ncbi:MAG: hypothetical protein ABW019_01035 [Chitinophagaceae bacterium]
MKRKEFIRNSMLAGAAIGMPGWLNAMGAPGKGKVFLKMRPDPVFPQLSFFSIDSLGKNKVDTNVILQGTTTVPGVYTSSSAKGMTRYRLASQPAKALPVWQVQEKTGSFQLTSYYHPGHSQPFLFEIEHHVNHATLLGLMNDKDGTIRLPAVLHFPDMGTLRVSCSVPVMSVACNAQRFIEHSFVKVHFPAATAEHPRVVYDFEVVTIHPRVKGIEHDPRYDCFRRNFISILQLNPFLKILANNTASDACAFTLFKYATMAAQMPPLAQGLQANDLIRITLDRYLAGTKGYGLLGYDYDKEWDIPETATTCHSLDSYPSLLLSACIYTLSSRDAAWFQKNYAGIKAWADKMLSMDKDKDGLLEFCLSGNSGSWKGDKTQRPANWWDTIGFGHKDAYSNALAYRALVLFDQAIRQYGAPAAAAYYGEKAAKLRSVYTDTFYNAATGILAGWKSADGQLHDYYFVFVNTVAISYDLIEEALANRIMDRLLQKMKEVGFTNFELGLPGNLIPVIRADYTDLLPEVGGGKREDNLDGFQIYENGGATACFTYFTIHALQKLKRKKDADAIMLPMLKSMSEGNFQGRCANGRTRDWKTWSGECWGYEGFLVDNYLFLLAVLEKEATG